MPRQRCLAYRYTRCHNGVNCTEHQIMCARHNISYRRDQYCRPCETARRMNEKKSKKTEENKKKDEKNKKNDGDDERKEKWLRALICSELERAWPILSGRVIRLSNFHWRVASFLKVFRWHNQINHRKSLEFLQQQGRLNASDTQSLNTPCPFKTSRSYSTVSLTSTGLPIHDALHWISGETKANQKPLISIQNTKPRSMKIENNQEQFWK